MLHINTQSQSRRRARSPSTVRYQALEQMIRDGRYEEIQQCWAQYPDIFPRDNTLVYMAVEENLFPTIVQFLRNVVGCSWDGPEHIPEDICKVAAHKQLPDTLEYLHSAGCPWDSSNILVEAATCDVGLECMKYLRANGVQWSPEVVSEAAEEGCWRNVFWAVVNGCSYDANELFQIMIDYEERRAVEEDEEPLEDLLDPVIIYECYEDDCHYLTDESFRATLIRFYREHLIVFQGPKPIYLLRHLHTLF